MKQEAELRSDALAALRVVEPDAKLSAIKSLVAMPPPVDVWHAYPEPPNLPGRPARPKLVAPGDVPRRPVSTREGHAALVHAIAHIEFNAINLALDAIWRFAGLPPAYYRDWLQVASEEAHHFAMLRERLIELGFDYGSFDAHTGLWDMAQRTSGDVLARMALVPRTLEARGLDASPAVRAKLASIGDLVTAQVIDIILRDEIGHVAIGNRWYRFMCAQRGVDSLRTWTELTARYGAPRQRGPFNLAARRAAGFDESELAVLET